MNALIRSTLVAAMLVLPVAAFAQSNVPVDASQVEIVAYEVVSPDSAPAQVHTSSMGGQGGTYAGTLSDSQFNPAADVGMKSIYVRH